MPSTIQVNDGEQIEQDPDAILVYEWDWDDYLGSTAQIVDSTWILTLVKPRNGTGTLTKDNEQVSATARATQVRLQGGAAGHVYTVTNRITTNENPLQGDDRSVRLVIVGK